MQKTLIIFFAMSLAGCTALAAGALMGRGVTQVNSYIYEVAATRSDHPATDLEEARQQVYTVAKAYCAKQDRVVETDTLIRLEEDAGRPASATLRFRCVKPDQPEPLHNAQS